MTEKITQGLLDSLTEQAKASPRLRMNLDLRNSAEDKSQRMLNAIEPGSPLPIHRHTKSSETVVCLRGKLVEEFYDELEMVCTESIELSPNGPVVALNIPIGQWHTVRALESGTVILECKDGAYEPLGPEDTLEVELVGRLKTFLENEARSCSIDPACVTPEYVCRMLGGTMAPEDIAESLEKAKALLKGYTHRA
jgi:Uncharacterized conserved protein, contains double-stranded beta-helix domain